MAPAANPLDDPHDAAALRGHADALVESIDTAITAWVARGVTQRWSQWNGATAPRAVVDAGRAAGEHARRDVVPKLRDLLAADVDEQRSTPLSLLRAAVVHPTRTLRDLGVPPVARDEQADRLFPEDAYDLAPAAFADLGPTVHERGIAWGAAKAHVILARRRRG